ncbi:unnamed protein product [Colias eurytheme]|nr:unnamed protein product [Colias eurytheme]
MMNIKLPGYKDSWSILQIYSPTEQSDLDTIEKFYFDLNNTIQEHANKNLIVMGDFNAQIGAKRPEEDTVLGPFTYSNKNRSRNGEKLINFALENHLTILNSIYKKNTKKMWTWISPDGKTKNEIDFIMTNKKNCLTNFDVINRFNYNTNHKLIRAEIKSLQPRKPRPRQELTIGKLSKHQMEQLVVILRDKFTDFKDNTKTLGTQQKYNWIENTIKDQLHHIAKIRSEPKKWLTTNTLKLLEQRNQLINAKEVKDRRKHLAKISKDIKESIRTDRKNSRMEIIEKHIVKTGGVKKAHRELTNSKDWITKIKNEKGQWNHHRSNILGIATSYYKQIYEYTEARDISELKETSNVPYILQTEVIKAIDSQKRDKAPGPDGINNEILKECKNFITPILTDMFNEILNTETIPRQWTESNIILLYKKGDKHEIGNYRPISLMSNIYKVFAKIILNRIERKLDEHQPIEQAGFRKHYSTIDHIHVVRQVIEKYKEYQCTYYIAFIDYSKAFDSLFHENIWESLKEQGIEHKYIRLIKNVYSQSTARIQLEQTGEPFRVGKGVRQGDPLSPKIFSAVLESIFRRLNWENLGINVNGVLLTHLRFADDIVLFAKSSEDITKMIKELATESMKVGLKLNPEKTRVMTNGERITINLGTNQIDYTDEYIYLGQLITDDNQMCKEVERRITNAWKRSRPKKSK